MAPFVGALLGVQPLDLVTFGGAPSVLGTLLPGVPLGTDNGRTLVWIILATLPLQALAAVPVVWLEEWGWRGYLLPCLLPLGPWRALLGTGAVWGLWHVPAVLAGLNYPGQPLLGSIAIIIGSIVWGVLLGWTRLASGSVWPAVLGHAALNTAAVVPLLLAPAHAPPNPVLVGVSGLTGWILPVVVTLLLIAVGQLPRPGWLIVRRTQ